MIVTDDQEETDRCWHAIVGNEGMESACGWCTDRWGFSWQITPKLLTSPRLKMQPHRNLEDKVSSRRLRQRRSFRNSPREVLLNIEARWAAAAPFAATLPA